MYRILAYFLVLLVYKSIEVKYFLIQYLSTLVVQVLFLPVYWVIGFYSCTFLEGVEHFNIVQFSLFSQHERMGYLLNTSVVRISSIESADTLVFVSVLSAYHL